MYTLLYTFLIKVLFDYWIWITIHNESEPEVNPAHTRHAH